MNLKPIKALSSSIKAKQDEVNQLLKDKSRCQDAVAAAGQHQDEINALLQEGAAAKAKAFLTRTEADTSQIEKRVAELETKNSETLSQGRVAGDALILIEQQLEKLQAEIAELIESRTSQTIDTLRAEYASAEQQYEEALNVLRRAIERLLATAGAHDRLSTSHKLFPSAYQYVITNRNEFLANVSTKPHGCPGWLWDQNLGDTDLGALLDELASAGLPIARPNKVAA